MFCYKPASQVPGSAQDPTNFDADPDPDPGGQNLADPTDPDPDPKHWFLAH